MDAYLGIDSQVRALMIGTALAKGRPGCPSSRPIGGMDLAQLIGLGLSFLKQFLESLNSLNTFRKLSMFLE